MAKFFKILNTWPISIGPYYEMASFLSIDNIAAKIEDATPCSPREFLQTKKCDARRRRP